MVILQVKDVTHHFKGLTALNDINFQTEEGQILGIIGPNGAGKTTLFNIITGFLKPSAGSVLFREENLVGLSPEKIARKGLVRSFQGAGLFPQFSCLENLVMAYHLYKPFKLWSTIFHSLSYNQREKEVKEKSIEILKKLGLKELINKPAHDIPYGHQKMIGVAMAVATGAELILLDEPVAGMNPSEALAMEKEIRQIQKNLKKTFVLVEHNIKMVMGLCDWIVVIHYGQKIAEGPPEKIKKDSLVIQAYLGEEE